MAANHTQLEDIPQADKRPLPAEEDMLLELAVEDTLLELAVEDRLQVPAEEDRLPVLVVEDTRQELADNRQVEAVVDTLRGQEAADRRLVGRLQVAGHHNLQVVKGKHQGMALGAIEVFHRIERALMCCRLLTALTACMPSFACRWRRTMTTTNASWHGPGHRPKHQSQSLHQALGRHDAGGHGNGDQDQHGYVVRSGDESEGRRVDEVA